jgi:hypothetical protein
MHCKRLKHIRATRPRKSRTRSTKAGCPISPLAGHGRDHNTRVSDVRVDESSPGRSHRSQGDQRSEGICCFKLKSPTTANVSDQRKRTPQHAPKAPLPGWQIPPQSGWQILTRPGRCSPDTSAHPSCNRRPCRTPQSSAPFHPRGTCQANADPPSPSSASTPVAGSRTRSVRSR